jgi:iron complex outermembrane recepter protein
MSRAITAGTVSAGGGRVAFSLHMGWSVRRVLLSGCIAAAPSVTLAQTALPPITIEADGPAAAATDGQTASGPDKSIVAETTSVGTKTDTPLIDIPAGVSVVTEIEMEKRAVQDLQQAISYTSSVMVDEFGSDDRYDFFRIRGFDQTATGTYRDGLPMRIAGWTASRLETYGLQRLEILKGSTSSLFGLNAPGGIVNAITKRPQDVEPRGEVYTTVGEDHIEAGTDFGGRINDDWSYRITMKRQEASDRGDFSSDDRLYIAPALTWRPTDATTLTILADYNKRDGNTAYGFPFVDGSIVNIDRKTFLGEPGFNKFDTVEKNIGYVFEHKFGSGFTLRQNARYTDLTLDYEQVYGASTNPDATREAFAVYGDTQRFAVDTQLQYDASWNGVKTKTLAGVDYARDKVHEDAYYTNLVKGIDIYNPDYCGRECVTSVLFPYQNWKPGQRALGFYLQEELTFDNRWIVTLGGRYDDVDTTTDYPDLGTTTESADNAFTKRLGLTYKVRDSLALYSNYSESFQPLLQPAFSPQEGTQYEAGAKYRPAGINALFTLALFDLTQTNVPTFVDQNVQRQIGEVNVRGIELEGKVAMDDHLNLTMAYSYWDAEIVEDGVAPNEGNRPARVPEHLASIWADYTIPGNAQFGALTLGAGVRFVGSTYADDENTLSIDAHAVVDAAIKYQITDDMSLAVNATNLFDKEYLSSVYFGTAYLGDGRTVRATLKHTW